tara:strand:- start:80 stop:580 length:501 start_codon:yes stop_codon:yes gene_type:complete
MYSKVSIRACKFKDAKFLLNTHNFAVKNGFFSSRKVVALLDHNEWLKSKLKNKSSKIYIGYRNRKKFGYVRFEVVKKNIYQVSICNAPKFYGQGLGNKMLSLGIKKFNKLKKPKKIVCIVKKFNKRSERCFVKNGFIKTTFNKKKHFLANEIDTKKENYYEYKIIN